MPAKRAVPHIDFKHQPITSCFGIQPIIVNVDNSIDCYLFNLYRKYKAKKFKNKKVVKMFSNKASIVHVEDHFKTEEEKKEIVKNAINYYQMPRQCIKAIYDNALRCDFDITIDEFIAQGKDYIKNILMCSALTQFIFNKLVTGNRFVTSNKALLDAFLPVVSVLGITKKILVPEVLVPRNEIIVCANGGMTFDNGILLCPLIYQKEFNKWLFEHDKSDDFSYMTHKSYPIMRDYRYKCDLYGEFMNECIPLEWHIEVFEKNARAFYTILHFKP